MISALSGIGHARARRGVLRHPHIRRPRCRPRLDAVRQDPGGGSHQHHDRCTGRGFRQSIFMVADELGFDMEAELRTTHEMAVATAPIDSPIGPIRPGTVAAQRFVWEATVDGEPVVTAAVNWLMGEEHLDPAWKFGQGGERFEVEITGDPKCLTTFKKLHPQSVAAGLVRNPGIVATALHCVNAIPYVCQAEAGLLTYLDLPLVSGRAGPGLHRSRHQVKKHSRS